tara:strand:- start:18062 stop:18238 length:177 start_codon:yes stop_codon:yes gene_type:complete
MAEGNLNWDYEGSPSGLKNKAQEILNLAKKKELNIPKGYKAIWVDGPLRAKIRKIVKE